MERGPLEYLFSLEQYGIKFGLENIRALLNAFGHPERSFQVLHVAGTNGKGSVTAMADAMLRGYFELTGKRPRGKVLGKTPLAIPGQEQATPEASPAASPEASPVSATPVTGDGT